ncbi:MAG TPA: hypothetical protein VFE37_20620 [Chloroflexota bacterium]|nr:hypothetical protein [Chloroflexota bacterium]
MILCDRDIKAAIEDGRIGIDPPPSQEQVSTSALDLILGDEFFQFITPEDLQAQQPPGAVLSLAVDTLNIDIRAFQSRYATRLDAPEGQPFRMESGGSS